MLIKPTPSNMSKQRWRQAIIGDFRGFCQKMPHMQFLKVRIEWKHNFLATILQILDIKIMFSVVSSLKKILNLTSDSINIQTLFCSFV